MAKIRSRKTPSPHRGEGRGEGAAKIVARRYAVGVTDHVLNTISHKNDPVAKQYLPDLRELKIAPEELLDPTGDDAHSPVKGIVHRYPDRALFKLLHACAVYCRFCFRREMVGQGKGALKPAESEAALDYIRRHPRIWEVILTGGDPFVLSPRRLAETLDALCTIDHVKVIRLHTRVPVADPARVTEELCAALRRDKAVYVALHINHAQEITPGVERAIKMLRDADCVLLSQSVLLKGVNDDPAALEELFRALAALRVKPYRLYHPDMAPGTGHFRLSIRRGQDIMRKLLGRVSGLCLPAYMVDIPGGHGKIPLEPSFIEETGEGRYVLTDFQGARHDYRESAGD